MSKHLAYLRGEVKRLTELERSATEAVQRLKKQREALKSENERVKGLLWDVSKERKQLQNIRQDQAKQIAELRDKCAQEKLVHERYFNELESVRDERDNLQRCYNALSESNEQFRAQLEQQLAQAQRERDSAGIHIRALHDTISQMEHILKLVGADMENDDEDILDLEPWAKSVAASAKERDQLRADLEAAKRENEALKVFTERFNRMAYQKHEALAAARERIADLTEIAEFGMNNLHPDAECSFSGTVAEYKAALSTQSEATKGGRSEVEQAPLDLDEDLKGYQSELASVTAELERLRADLEAVKREREQLRDYRQHDGEKLVEAFEKNQKLQSDLEAVRKEQAHVNEQLQRLASMPIKAVVDGYLRLLRKLNERDKPEGFNSWEDYHQHIMQQGADLATARERIEVLESGIAKQSIEIEQSLGRALGYPWYKDDQKSFPGSTEDDGVCVGEHVPETLAVEAASRIVSQKQRIKVLEGALRGVLSVIDAHELESLDCDQAGERWCDCLENEVKKAKAALSTQSESEATGNSLEIPDSSLRAENEQLRAERDRLRAELELVRKIAANDGMKDAVIMEGRLGMIGDIVRRALSPEPTPEQPAAELEH